MMRKSRQPKKITWKSFLLLFIVIIIAGGLKIKQQFFTHTPVPTSDVPSVSYDDVKPDDETPVKDPAVPTNDPVPPAEDAPAPVTDTRPESFNLAVPFTSQAPFGNWDALHEDTCEEASVYMVTQFYDGNKAEVLDPTKTDEYLKDIVAKEEAKNIGPSAFSQEIVDLLKSDYGETAKIIENPSVEDIKALIAKGYPVIVPAAGRELGNPFFTGEGPLYHMFVIRGYTRDSFITNDPGTRNGKNYTYKTEVVMNAMGDWNSGDPTNGPKRVIIIEPTTSR
jgi:hypothetical protein